ncbi:hypothetical protein IFM89_030199 [Coptis chinensis]|uniref:Uncharacterized protein n=1 Tax=Coptis chinensis TaxID=261450 RepID=A0A835HSU6_9MAGN|nr:hypothetical protein IFM89_030199 [Coptis chinensis]
MKLKEAQLSPLKPPDKEQWGDIHDEEDTGHSVRKSVPILKLVSIKPTPKKIGRRKATSVIEKKGGLQPTNAAMTDFRDAVSHNHLIEASSTGFHFTWTNKQKVGWIDSIPKPKNAPFRFFNMWTKHPDFLKVVEENWKAPIVGHSLFILAQKLKRLKRKLNHWNKNVFGMLSTNIAKETTTLKALQQQFEQDENEMLALEIAEQEL